MAQRGSSAPREVRAAFVSRVVAEFQMWNLAESGRKSYFDLNLRLSFSGFILLRPERASRVNRVGFRNLGAERSCAAVRPVPLRTANRAITGCGGADSGLL